MGGSFWCGRDLSVRVCRALDIAKATLSEFGSTGYKDKDTPELSFGAEKPVAEVAMLLYAVSGCLSAPEIRNKFHDLAGHLSRFARCERVLVEVAMNPAFVIKFALPHILLSRMGYPDPEFDTTVKVVASNLHGGVDRPTSAILEGLWVSEIWTGGTSKRRVRREIRNSLLAQPLCVLTSRREQVYALTHLMFYVSDFGFTSEYLPSSRTWLASQSRSLLARFLDAEDYDLAAEILLTWPFMRIPWDAASSFAFGVLAAAETAAGMLPCGNVDIGKLADLSGPEQYRYALARSYHTALVMGVLCAALLRPSRQPPCQYAGAQYTRDALQEFLPFIGYAQGHWQEEFNKLGDAQQTVLVPFLVDLAIAQRARQKDYAAIGRLLMMAQRAGVPASPMISQASDQLVRLARISAEIGARRDAGSSRGATMA